MLYFARSTPFSLGGSFCPERSPARRTRVLYIAQSADIDTCSMNSSIVQPGSSTSCQVNQLVADSRNHAQPTVSFPLAKSASSSPPYLPRCGRAPLFSSAPAPRNNQFLFLCNSPPSRPPAEISESYQPHRTAKPPAACTSPPKKNNAMAAPATRPCSSSGRHLRKSDHVPAGINMFTAVRNSRPLIVIPCLQREDPLFSSATIHCARPRCKTRRFRSSTSRIFPALHIVSRNNPNAVFSRLPPADRLTTGASQRQTCPRNLPEISSYPETQQQLVRCRPPASTSTPSP